MANEEVIKKLAALIPDRFGLILMRMISLLAIWSFFSSKTIFSSESFFLGSSLSLSLVAFILFFRKRKVLKDYTEEGIKQITEN